MNSLRNVGIRASLNGHAVPILRPSMRRTVVYKQLFQHIKASNLHSLSAHASNSTSLLRPAPLRSKLLPHEVKIGFAPTTARSFHHGPRLGQQKEARSAGKEEPVAEEDTAKKASSGDSNSTPGEEKAKEEKAGESDGKKEEQKEAPPPPPHGDKSPWQVFTETLQSEFKASKEWNESTKALAAGAQQFTENESVRRAREAYERSTGAVSSTTAKVLKNTAGVVGKGASWTWETPVVKAARTTVNATASVIEKGTRPIRETEAYQSVKNVIDDGSSSRYGGWVEKEERRKRREIWEKQEAERLGTGGRRAEVAQEDPL
jgi:import inner membrane translocase subunit TIM44